jgi:hypothetical protein
VAGVGLLDRVHGQGAEGGRAEAVSLVKVARRGRGGIAPHLVVNGVNLRHRLTV